MSEKAIQSHILLAIGRKRHVRVFRNNVGKAKATDGRFIVYGLHVGSGDLIGWQTVIVTADMVGKPLARFLSIEVKTPIGRLRPEQKTWQDAVNTAGGLAIVARDPEDVTPL